MKRMKNFNNESAITLVALIITIIILIILAAVTIKVVTDMKILDFAIKGTEDYSKAQDKEMEDFEKIENLLTDTISNIQSGNISFTEEDIGKYVNYIPQGSDYTVQAKYSGHSTDQVFSQDTSLKWQIWKVENDTLYIISDILPSTSGYENKGNLLLSNAQGYNNGVTLLDNICKSNYGINGKDFIQARNLKTEDVLGVLIDEIEPENEYGTQPSTYPASGTFNFPIIWYNNEIDSFESADKNRSIAYPLVESTSSTISLSNQKPYYTLWLNDNTSKIESWKSSEYYDMILKPAQNKLYWLSSRYAKPYSPTNCTFGLQCISTKLSAYYTYSCPAGTTSVGSADYGVRPLVQIPLSECEITESTTSGMDFDITIK